MAQPGRNWNDASGDYRYGYNGKEKDDEIKGEANSVDYGARIYDPRVGRWMSVDPLENDYPSWSSYNYVMDDPINSVDPDGKRVFFVGGANNDKDGWNYISRFKRIWTEEGLEGFMRIDASYGRNGDIRFTDLWRDKRSYGNFYASNEWAVKKATQDILNDLFSNPLKTGEQLNVAGYSYGSIVQAHVALALIKEGKKVDNLILIGSPIPDDSDLMAELKEMENIGKIGKIIRHDIENDMLSNPGCTIEYLFGGLQNSSDSGPHFDLARPDDPKTKDINESNEADNKIRSLAKRLKNEGVE